VVALATGLESLHNLAENIETCCNKYSSGYESPSNHITLTNSQFYLHTK